MEQLITLLRLVTSLFFTWARSPSHLACLVGVRMGACRTRESERRSASVYYTLTHTNSRMYILATHTVTTSLDIKPEGKGML